jgi:transcription-repair coupling factor (superfamily II helicase)
MVAIHSPFQPPAPPPAGQRMSWNNLPGGAAGLAVARAAAAHQGLTLVVTHSTASAQRMLDELGFYAAGVDLLHFPDWETLAYDAFSPHQDIISERLATLRALPGLRTSQQSSLLVVPVQTLLQRIAPRSYLDGHSLVLTTGQHFDIAAERSRLAAAGYQAVETVSGRGEYAVRGSLMDIFPMGAELPVRIDLMDNEIESLRTFDPETQRTIQRINDMRLLPAKEFPLDPAAIARFRDNWHNTFNVDVRRCNVYQDVSEGIPPGGVEYYLPFFFPELNTLFDYLPESTLVIRDAEVSAVAARHIEDIHGRFENLRHDIERPIIEPGQVFLSEDELNAGFKPHAQLLLNDKADARHQLEFAAQQLPDVQANPRLKEPAAALLNFLSLPNERGNEGGNQRTLFVADTAGRREVFHEFLNRAGIRPTDVDDLATFLESDLSVGITIAPIEQGLWLDTLRVITESEVFGHQVKERRAKSARTLDPEQIIKNLTELHIGEAVVHIEHGIGRYLGLMTLDIDGSPNEFLTVEYAEEAKLYVPVTSLHLISRYSGAENAPVHRLGSDTWDKAKRKAAEKIHDVAAELLNIYARRETNVSYQFDPPGDDYQRFADQFPFEVTFDQQTAIDEVIADLCSPQATDRLICGDVGFGKTEVAMRAAFMAAQSNKQVAILVPTTLLAQQHLDTFRDRFADWPLQIEAISRLRSDSEVAEVGQRLTSGKVDILIGTHKLLNPAISFKDLGLVIIDEEHRFGVRQKEQLRSLRAEVDVLTLTATPIPRTLNMAMSGMRDLSIIATPPAKRLSIKTFVQEKRRHVIKEAITRELLRGGQVFYLHNEVRNIEEVADDLAELVPEARIGVGHGQMPKRELETVMNDFYHRQLNLLVCTTIIETGIDIPNANTIIMERADKFGLAQLHQLRGRVGRSHRQAYAYLLIPHPKALTPDAIKRLEAIEAAGELGVGFTLATHDMEIRGAGELLGDEQSGQIESVGFSLYMDLLDRAVNAIRDGKTPDMDSPLEPVSREVNLHTATLIPESYLPDIHGRLILYKRIANAASDTELNDLQGEMIDRFGLLPDPLKALFQLTGLRLKTQPLGILRLDLGEHGGRIEFSPQTTVDPLAVVKLVQQLPATYRLEGATVLRVTRELKDVAARLAFAEELLERLAPELPQATGGKTDLAANA